MEQEENEILEILRKLDPENRADLLAHTRVAYAAQERTKRHYGILPEIGPAGGTPVPGIGRGKSPALQPVV
jgi:hypothetical protein